MPKPLGLDRKPGYWDRHKKRWVDPPGEGKKSLSSKGGDHNRRKQMVGQFIPFDDPRRIECPVCGEIVPYAVRRMHTCHTKYMRQVRDNALEFEAGMVVSMGGGRKGWEQYGV